MFFLPASVGSLTSNTSMTGWYSAPNLGALTSVTSLSGMTSLTPAAPLPSFIFQPIVCVKQRLPGWQPYCRSRLNVTSMRRFPEADLAQHTNDVIDSRISNVPVCAYDDNKPETGNGSSKVADVSSGVTKSSDNVTKRNGDEHDKWGESSVKKLSNDTISNSHIVTYSMSGNCDTNSKIGLPIEAGSQITATTKTTTMTSHPVPLYCSICRLSLNAPRQAREHFEGRGHARRVKLCQGPRLSNHEKLFDVTENDGADKEQSVSPCERRPCSVTLTTASSTTSSCRPNIYCRLCSVAFNSDKQAVQHYSGKAHARRLRHGSHGNRPNRTGTNCQSTTNIRSTKPERRIETTSRLPSGRYYCCHCDVTMASFPLMNKHSIGLKHIEACASSRRECRT